VKARSIDDYRCAGKLNMLGPTARGVSSPTTNGRIRVAGRLGMTPLRNDVFHDRRMIVHCVARDTWLRSQQAKPA
jgi:hypothetical protein